MRLAALCGALLLGAAAWSAEPKTLWLGPKLSAPAERVITVAPSLTDTVLKLGAGATLIGVSRFDEDPAVAKLPRVGGFVDPSVETVVALKPQLVIVQKAPGNQQAVEKIASLGISVLALPMTTTQDVLDAIAAIGGALGREEPAKQLVKEIVMTRAEVRPVTLDPRAPRPKVMIIYGFKPLVVAGPGSFADELLTDVGGVNVAARAKTAYPVYSLERAVALQPDVVIDCSDVADGRDETKAMIDKPRWVQPKSRALLQPGPSLATGLRELRDAVQGEAVRVDSGPAGDLVVVIDRAGNVYVDGAPVELPELEQRARKAAATGMGALITADRRSPKARQDEVVKRLEAAGVKKHPLKLQ